MRNLLHLKAPGNWINDPNGFIYYQGMYHLFYQHFPYGPRWGTMHWGHAVSKDLVSWEHKKVALFPTKYEDQNGCFSGSAIEHDGQMILYYTGVHYNHPDPNDIHLCQYDQFESSQMMIRSKDGYHFDNFHGKRTVLRPQDVAGVGDATNTRDPKVWRGKDAWYMILGSTVRRQKGEVLFYRSENLTDWTFVNSASKGQDFGWMWECPDYFETEGGKVLVFSPMGFLQEEGYEANHSIISLVEFEEETCTMKIPDEYQFLDYGLDLYAPQSTVDAEGRRVLVAWLRMPHPVDESWCGMYCLPRVVEVRNGHIYSRVHPNVEAAYSVKISSPEEACSAGYRVSLELTEGACVNIGGYVIRRQDGKICTDRTAVFCENSNFRLQSATPQVKDGSHVDIYVDENMIEVYVNYGEYVISNTVFRLGKEIRTENVDHVEISTLDKNEEISFA